MELKKIKAGTETKYELSDVSIGHIDYTKQAVGRYGGVNTEVTIIESDLHYHIYAQGKATMTFYSAKTISLADIEDYIDLMLLKHQFTVGLNHLDETVSRFKHTHWWKRNKN